MLHRYKITAPLLLLAIIMLAVGCTKVDKVEDVGGGGQTIVKIVSEDGYALSFVELKSATQTINLMDVRRDIPNEAELNKTMKVTIKEDPAVLTVYNSHLDPADRLNLFPGNSFTPDPGNPRSGSDYAVTFAPGEYSKFLKITVPNATVLDPNEKYGLGFLITAIDQTGKISKVLDTCVVEIGVKNKYDGHYKVTGEMTDVQAPNLTGKYPFEVDLETADANTVFMYHTGSPFTGYYHPIMNGAAVSAYGNFAVTIEFSDNTVVDVYNGYGQGTGSRFGLLDPTGINTYDPDTKTILVKYKMMQPDIGTLRTVFTEKFEYMGPR